MKKGVVFAVVMLTVAAFFLINLGRIITDLPDKKNDTVIDLSFFEKSIKDAKDIENEIREAEKIRFEQYGGSTEEQIQETLRKLEADELSFRQVFAGTFVAGDSLVNSLELYDVLDADMLATQVSASFTHLSENISAIIAANPENVILHYGINMISTEKSQLKSFIDTYSKLVTDIKNGLPEARIIISGLFPVDTTIETRAAFKKIADYNKALSQMCDELGIDFLDSTEAFKGNEDYYAYDGIHLSLGFYTDVWLPYIIEHKGIIG